MPVEATGFTLMILGATATVAAIAGQLNLAGVAEFPLMSSRALRAVLFVVGGFFFIFGFSLVDRAATTSSGTADPTAQPSSTVAVPPNARPSSPSSAKNTSPETDAPPTLYAEVANAACASAADRAQALPDLPAEATDDQLVMYTLTWADNIAVLWDSLANVSVAAVPEDHETLLFKLDLYHDNLEDAAFGLRAGDGYTFDNNIDQVESLAFDYNRVARALNLPACVISK